MVQFVPFGLTGKLINPDLIYSIDRVTDTVSFELEVTGLPAGTLFTEDFTFGSVQDAIDALAAFLAAIEKGSLALDEITCCVSEAIISNPKLYEDITRVADRQGQIPIDELRRVILEFAVAIKADFDAL